MTITEIESGLTMIRKYLDLSFTNGDPHMAMEKMSSLINLMGLSAECHAEAERYYNIKIAELWGGKEYGHLNSTDKKLLFTGKAANEIKLMTLAEQYSKKLDKAVEGLRTMISYAKNEQSQFNRS